MIVVERDDRPMKASRIAMIVLGSLVVVPAAAVLLAGGALAGAYAFARDDDGYFRVGLDRIETATAAVTAEDIDLAADPGTPDFLIDRLDVDVRLDVTSAASDRSVFVGIAPQADVDAYLAGVAHDEVDHIDGSRPEYRTRTGTLEVAPPTAQGFWSVATSGTGTQVLDWEATAGRWAVVVMNADGGPGVAADVEVGVRSGVVLPLALTLIGIGLVGTIAGVVLIVAGATGGRREPASPAAAVAPVEPTVHPVALTARLDPELSRWRWLVKWFLAIPHFIVLTFLWVAFVVLTVVAFFAIVFTGRYPRGIFDFNVGVLRWSWRVTHYATVGGIGTDRYPPFSLAPDPAYPADLDVAYPERLSRGLVWVKWWLLALPHYVVVALLVGGTIGWTDVGWDGVDVVGGGGLLGVLVLVAGVILLFTGAYPPALWGLIVGFNRWVYRVIAYAALMTDEYPPFRLDQGGDEVRSRPPDGAVPPAAVDLREPTVTSF